MSVAQKAPRAKGKRHRLLFYQHTMDRIWRHMLLLAPVLWLAWWRASAWKLPALQPPRDLIVLLAALLATGFLLFALLARFLAFVQPARNHVLIATPFLRLKISYRRLKSVRAVEVGQLFTPGSLSWANKRFMRPYFSSTAVVLLLHGYPMSPLLLRLFLPKQFFHPKEVGVVLVVRDWMSLSTDIDTLYGNWKESHSRRPESHFRRGLLRG